MKQAPDFTLQDQHGDAHSLVDYAGKWLVLYFYPKDGTDGCTAEACNFRDARDIIQETGKATVVGVSKDSVESHHKFAEDNKVNFTILSDPEHKVIEAYDSWDPTFIVDGELFGTRRNTFIISPTGEIAKEYHGVDPKTHAVEIIEDLKALQQHQES